MIHNLCNITR